MALADEAAVDDDLAVAALSADGVDAVGGEEERAAVAGRVQRSEVEEETRVRDRNRFDFHKK